MRFLPAPPGIVRCPKCGLGVPGETWSGPGAHTCPSCRSEVSVRLFPALRRTPPPSEAGERAVPGDAVCFFHGEKKAERACDRCGRFLCALCDLPVGARHVCPACLESGMESGERLPELVTARLSWGRLALSIAVLPLAVWIFIWPFLVFTAPAAIFCALYGWRKPPSLVHGRRRAGAIVALIVSLAELTGLLLFFVLIWKAARHG